MRAALLPRGTDYGVLLFGGKKLRREFLVYLAIKIIGVLQGERTELEFPAHSIEALDIASNQMGVDRAPAAAADEIRTSSVGKLKRIAQAAPNRVKVAPRRLYIAIGPKTLNDQIS